MLVIYSKFEVTQRNRERPCDRNIGTISKEFSLELIKGMHSKQRETVK